MKTKRVILALLLAMTGLCSLSYGIVGIHGYMQWNALMSNQFMPPDFLFPAALEILPQAFLWMSLAWICLLVFSAILPFSHKSQKATGAYAHSSLRSCEGLQVNINDNTISYEDFQARCRRQVILLLQHLVQNDRHELPYDELNHILGEHFFDYSPQARRKVSNLKYEMNHILKDTPFAVTNPTPNKFRLYIKGNKTREETQ